MDLLVSYFGLGSQSLWAGLIRLVALAPPLLPLFALHLDAVHVGVALQGDGVGGGVQGVGPLSGAQGDGEGSGEGWGGRPALLSPRASGPVTRRKPGGLKMAPPIMRSRGLDLIQRLTINSDRGH